MLILWYIFYHLTVYQYTHTHTHTHTQFKDMLNWFRSESKDIYNVTKRFLSFSNILKWKTVILNCNNISRYYYIFGSNNCSLGKHTRFISKHKIILPPPNFWMVVCGYICIYTTVKLNMVSRKPWPLTLSSNKVLIMLEPLLLFVGGANDGLTESTESSVCQALPWL